MREWVVSHVLAGKSYSFLLIMSSFPYQLHGENPKVKNVRWAKESPFCWWHQSHVTSARALNIQISSGVSLLLCLDLSPNGEKRVTFSINREVSSWTLMCSGSLVFSLFLQNWVVFCRLFFTTDKVIIMRDEVWLPLFKEAFCSTWTVYRTTNPSVTSVFFSLSFYFI